MPGSSPLRRLDLRIYRALRVPSPAEAPVRAFTALGEHAACWLALGAIGAAVDRRRRDSWLRGLRAVGISYLANTALKLVVRRRRPVVPGLPPLVKTPTQLSFPSAHATSSFAAVRAYAPLVPEAEPLYVLACALSLSRISLGVHYPSDVVAGAALGTLLGGALR